MDAKKGFYKSLIFILLLVFSIVSVSAISDDLMIKVVPIDDDISIYEEAKFNISVVNTNDFQENVNIYSPNIDAWGIKIAPDSFFIDSGEKVNVILRALPKKAILPGAEYGIQLNVKGEESNSFEKIYAFVSVKSQEQLNREYLPVIKVDMPELNEIDITEPVLYDLKIENKNVRDITDLEIVFSSDVFNKAVDVDLGPLETKTFQFSLDAPSHTKPQKDNMIVAFRVGNQTVLSRSIDYEIISIEKQGIEQSSVSSLMKKEIKAKLSNEGNVDIEGIYRVPTNLLNYFFITGNAKSRLVYHDGLFKEYYVDLIGGENYDLLLTISYRSLLYILAAVLIIVTLYYLLRSPLIIHKSVVSIKTKEDSLSELKVLLHVKNRTRKTFDNIIVLDKIPKITEMGKEFALGTLKPTKVMNHDKKGTIAKWEIKSLDSYEERVLTYKLYSNLTIVGGLTLPMSILKFKRKGSSEKKVVSNKVRLLIQKFKGERKE